jgi:hypothetical protein
VAEHLASMKFCLQTPVPPKKKKKKKEQRENAIGNLQDYLNVNNSRNTENCISENTFVFF